MLFETENVAANRLGCHIFSLKQYPNSWDPTVKQSQSLAGKQEWCVERHVQEGDMDLNRPGGGRW